MENKNMKKDDFRSSRARELPLAIIESEILVRLSAKSLFHCMFVCKQWKSIISSREFTRMNHHHLSKSLTNHKLLEINRSLGTFTTRDSGALDNHGSVTTRSIPPFEGTLLILQSLDGLLCVHLWGTCKVALWNPLTGAYKILCNSITLSDHRITDSFGFYYDSCNNDYKLLHVLSNGALGAYIYSEKSEPCRKIQCLKENHPCISNTCSWSPATLLGGSLYFVVRGKQIKGRHIWIIAFDVKSEKFREIQFPPVPCDAHFCESLVVVKGCIHLCVSYYNTETDFKHSERDLCNMMDGNGELWEMLDGDCWKKVAAFHGKQHYPPGSYDSVHVTRNGNSHVILEAKRSFSEINIEDLATNYKVNFHGNLRSSGSFEKTTFVETLMSPNC